MSFKAVDPAPGVRHEDVYISVSSGRGRPPRVRVTFHQDFLKKMGWTSGTALQPAYGDNQDAGLLRITEIPKGGFKLRNLSNGSRLAIEFKAHRGAPVKFAVSEPKFFTGIADKSITIELPWSNRAAKVARAA